MSKTQKQNNSSLLWDCFTNWSLTLEKSTEQKSSAKKTRNKNDEKQRLETKMPQSQTKINLESR